MQNVINALGPATAGLQTTGRVRRVGDGWSTPATLPGHGPVWLSVNGPWQPDGPGGPGSLDPATVTSFLADCGRLSRQTAGHPVLAPPLLWGGAPPRSRAHVVYRTGPGISLLALPAKQVRLPAPYAAGVVALVGRTWLDLLSVGIAAPTNPWGIWLEDAGRVLLADWLPLPPLDDQTTLYPEQAPIFALGPPSLVAEAGAFGQAIAVLLWFAVGLEWPSMNDVGRLFSLDWLTPELMPGDDAELGVIMQTALADFPPEPESLLRDLERFATTVEPPDRWMHVVRRF